MIRDGRIHDSDACAERVFVDWNVLRNSGRGDVSIAVRLFHVFEVFLVPLGGG